MPTAYKPSPLGYGSPPSRSSPFRRPESPASPSPLRYTTPTGSPTKAGPSASNGSPRLGQPSTPTSNRRGSWAPEEQTPTRDIMAPSPQRPPVMRMPTAKSVDHGNALSKLQPTQVRTLRDGFQILDRDCDGVVNRDDVADMLNQLGKWHGPCSSREHMMLTQPDQVCLPALLTSRSSFLHHSLRP